jgi:hypothetical protein
MFGLFQKRITYRLSCFEHRVGYEYSHGSKTEAEAVTHFINLFDMEMQSDDKEVYLDKMENDKVVSVEVVKVTAFKSRFGIDYPADSALKVTPIVLSKIDKILQGQISKSKYPKMYKPKIKIVNAKTIHIADINIFDLREYYGVEDVRDDDSTTDFYNNDLFPILKKIEMLLLREFKSPELKVTCEGDWDDQTVTIENFSLGG